MLETEHILEILGLCSELSQQITDEDFVIYLHCEDLTSVYLSVCCFDKSYIYCITCRIVYYCIRVVYGEINFLKLLFLCSLHN